MGYSQKLFFVLALLCTAVQGAWADTWDGTTYSKPEFYIKTGTFYNVIEISKASELAYVCKHFDEETGYYAGNQANPPKYFYTANYLLDADIDMGGHSWKPVGNDDGSITAYTGTFYGNGHTIRINISGATENYQGLFARIGEGGHVQDLYVAGNIQCTSSRLVGAIAGENYGTIEDCWVSADVSSDWANSFSSYDAKVGGICGENSGTIQYCCMTGNVTNDDSDVGGLVGCNDGNGTIRHGVFYGTRHTTNDQDNEYVGDQDGTTDELHTAFTDEELNTYLESFEGNAIYRNAIQNPFTITVSSEGFGTISSNASTSRSGKTIFLTIHTSGTGTMPKDFILKDADGNVISYMGSVAGGSVTFTMPKRNVTAKAIFTGEKLAERPLC